MPFNHYLIQYTLGITSYYKINNKITHLDNFFFKILENKTAIPPRRALKMI